MKRALSLIMAIVTCLSCCVLFASCGHECEWSADWSKDATHHWKACTDAECAEVNEKAEHTWGAGTEVDGSLQYTCSVCAQTKSEKFDTDVTEAEWLTAMNFTRSYFTVEQDTDYPDGTKDEQDIGYFGDIIVVRVNEMVVYYEKNDSKYYAYNKVGDQYVRTEVMGAYVFAFYSVLDFNAAMPYSAFTYDEAKGAYLCASREYAGAVMTNIVIKFKDGSVQSIAYDTTTLDGKAGHVTFNPKPETNVPALPSVQGTVQGGNSGEGQNDGTVLTASEWNAALNFTTDNYVYTSTLTNEDNSSETIVGGYYTSGLTTYRWSKDTITNDTVYATKDGSNYILYLVHPQVGEYVCYPVDEATYNNFVMSFEVHKIMDYDDFSYDSTLKAYTCASVAVEGGDDANPITNVVIKFVDGKLEYISFNQTNSEGEPCECYMTFTKASTVPQLPEATPIG